MINELEKYFDLLWPITRSITGNGLRKSFEILQEIAPYKLTEIPSGTPVFDWNIPKEWNINNAYIITPDGRKIADLKVNNLHVVNYSVPVNLELSFEELDSKLHYLESQPDAIPYITSYYKENWGFCISYNEYKTLPRQGKYKVYIDSTLENGALTYGEIVLEGSTDREILFSSYLCHPSMANNELSGPLALSFLYREISQIKNRKYTYRFILAPETIGIISFLSKRGELLKKKLDAGYVLTCVGDSGDFTYKKSKRANTLADRLAKHALTFSNEQFSIIDFSVGGSDERQYCSPGFNLPVGSLMRTPYQRYKEYHTSLDNKEFISFEALKQTILMYLEIVKTAEINDFYKNKIEYCEPQLGKRGLYPNSVNPEQNRDKVHRLMHFLTFADGENDLLSIAEKRNESVSHYSEIIESCKNANII